jgi:acyl-ACP thioesterase
MDIYSADYTVQFSDIDSSNRVRPDAVFDFFQNAATAHADALGVGRLALLSKNVGWVLSRMTVEFLQRPVCDEKITVRTWPRGAKKLFVARDFELTGDKGARVLARSYWLTIDVERRRPLRPEPIIENMPLNDGRDALDAALNEESIAALGERPGLEMTLEHTARYPDIDGFGHANNARYIEWIESALDADKITALDKYRLNINYISEVTLGQKVEIFTARLPENLIAVEGRHDGAASFRAEIKIL